MRHWALLTAAVVALGLLPLAGCNGRASVHLIPMGSKRISAAGPLILTITPGECYYWVNERDELCLAMRSMKRSILGGRFAHEFIVSLVLKGLPAGTARDYRVNRRTLRARRRAGLSHTRAASLAGIVGVWDYGKRRLRGRFRLSAKQQSYSVLTGWGASTVVLIIGDFVAVPDRKAGERIFAQTDDGGLKRPVNESPGVKIRKKTGKVEGMGLTSHPG